METTMQLGLRVALRKGLPYIIPPHFRSLIRKRHIGTICVVTSVLNSYKGLKDDWIIKPGSLIDTIVSEPFEFSDGKELEYSNFIVNAPFTRYGFDIEKYHSDDLHLSLASSPNGPISAINYLLELKAINNSPIGDHLNDYLFHTKSPLVARTGTIGKRSKFYDHGHIPEPALITDLGPLTMGSFPMTTDPVAWERHMETTFPHLFPELGDHKVKLKWTKDKLRGTQLGKIAIKLEPAGKVRTFAIVDSITQAALRPLHDMVFAYLKTIPADATFDQEGKLKSFMELNKGKHFWSFDLKAATDTIPRQLYRPILSILIGREAAQAWVDLLDRDYLMPTAFWVSPTAPYWTRYTRGQPMGAYSSWALLALLHHLIVAFANYRLTGDPRYPNGKYLVLGDDITFSDSALADSYKEVCSDYGIQIGLPKSYTNSTICNFANQCYLNTGENISPISLKELLQAHTLTRRLEFAKRLVRRGYIPEGNSNLFRVFFTPETWSNETKYLNKGTFSLFGKKVMSALLLPGGNSSVSATNVIMGVFPKISSLTHPRQDIEITPYDWGLGLPVVHGEVEFKPRAKRIIVSLIVKLKERITDHVNDSKIKLLKAFRDLYTPFAKTSLVIPLRFGGLRPPSTYRNHPQLLDLEPYVNLFKNLLTIDGLGKSWKDSETSLLRSCDAGARKVIKATPPELGGRKNLKTSPEPRARLLQWDVKGLEGTVAPARLSNYTPNLNISTQGALLSHLLQQAKAVGRINLHKLGYDKENVWDGNRAVIELIQLAYGLVPIIHPLVLADWKSAASFERQVKEGAICTDSRLLRDIRTIASALGYYTEWVEKVPHRKT